MNVWDLRTYGWKELRWKGKQACDEFRTLAFISGQVKWEGRTGKG